MPANDSPPKPARPTTTARRSEIAREKERERERETAGGGLAFQTAKGRRTGGGRGGGPGRVKGTGGFLLKIPVPNVFFADFVFSGPDPVATQDKEPKTHLSRRRCAKHIRT